MILSKKELFDRAYTIAQYVDLDGLEEALEAATARNEGDEIGNEQVAVLSKAVEITNSMIGA